MRLPDFKIVYSEEARAFFASSRVDNKAKRMLYDKIALLSLHPYFGKPLGGELHDFRRLAVSYYRVIYHVDEGNLVIDVIKVGLRRDVYDA